MPAKTASASVTIQPYYPSSCGETCDGSKNAKCTEEKQKEMCVHGRADLFCVPEPVYYTTNYNIGLDAVVY